MKSLLQLVCCCQEPCLFSHSHIAEVTSKSNFDSFQDHSYSMIVDNEVRPNFNKSKFSDNTGQDGILSKMALSEKELTPTKRGIYRAYRT